MISTRILLVLTMLLVLTGCAGQPTVYLYARYLDDNQIEAISQAFASGEFQLEINDFDFPTSITQSTILYSFLLNDPAMIEQAEQIVAEAGIPVYRIQGLTEGNHWYTKNSLAVFLLPDDYSNSGYIFRQDLIHDYQGEHCADGLSLSLNKDGSFVLSGDSLSLLDVDSHKGTWKYRQYPYIELTKQGSHYANYYFEISRFAERDNISDITFIKLSPLNTGFPEDCVFVYGIRE